MATYQHSESFALLKNIKEGISQNLTTYQYLEVLDFFLESAIDPLATAVPLMLDNFFSAVVAWQSHKPSVKFTRDDKFLLPSRLFNALTTDGSVKRQHQRSMLLNRGLLFGLLALFSRTINSYVKLHNPALRYSPASRAHLIAKAEYRLSAKHLYSATMQFRWYATKAYKFKELITQKYTRLALMSAKRTYTELACDVPLDDVIQVYLLYLNKAIDRCDSRQGVLTTFIQTWFYSAKTEVQRFMAASQHTSYEELLTKLPVDYTDGNDYETVQHLSHQAKKIDPAGVVRYSLGIPEFFTRQQCLKLKLFTTTN